MFQASYNHKPPSCEPQVVPTPRIPIIGPIHWFLLIYRSWIVDVCYFLKQTNCVQYGVGPDGYLSSHQDQDFFWSQGKSFCKLLDCWIEYLRFLLRTELRDYHDTLLRAEGKRALMRLAWSDGFNCSRRFFDLDIFLSLSPLSSLRDLKDVKDDLMRSLKHTIPSKNL